MTQRKPEISVMNLTLCLMVILLHCLSEAVTYLEPAGVGYILAFIPWKLASAAVYGFLFLSALKLFLPTNRPFRLGSFYRRRAQAVLLPYLIAVTVYVAVNALVSRSVPVAWELAKAYLLGDAATHLYFVVILFQLYLLMPLWRRMVERVSPAVAIPAALFISLSYQELLWLALRYLAPDYTLQYQDRFFAAYLGVWVAGCYAGRDYPRFLALLQKNRHTLWALCACFAATSLIINYVNSGLGVWMQSAGMVNNFYICAAIPALYRLSCRLAETRLTRQPLFQRLDRASYHIYLYHILILLAADRVMNRLGLIGLSTVGPRLALRLAAVLLGTGAVCLAWQALTDRVKKRSKVRAS